MILLAIDTSTDRAVIALRDGAGAIRRATTDAGRRHGRDLVSRLKDVLDASAIAPGRVEAIAVGLGPGSYTGSRVGVTAAKTLAYATGAALIGLDSLRVVARNAPAEARRIWAIADAQRGDIYAAGFVRRAPGAVPEPSGPTRVEAVAAWAARLEAVDVVLGPGLALPRILDRVPEACRAPAGVEHAPTAEGLIAAALEAIASGRRDDPATLEPLYLRRSSAEDLWDSRPSRGAP